MVDDYYISKTPVELPTFLFNGNYRSPSFAFQHQHLSSFSAVLYLVTKVKFYKMIFRFNLFNLPIDHLHKLISPLSIEFIRMELRLHYVCIPMYCDTFASGLLFNETTRKVWIKLLPSHNVAITTIGRLGLKWLPTVSWKVGEMKIFAFSYHSLGRGVAAYTYF